MVYTLKKNTTESLFEDSGRTEKSDYNVYLYDSQWEALDHLADKTGKSRNQVLREILKEHFQNIEE